MKMKMNMNMKMRELLVVLVLVLSSFPTSAWSNRRLNSGSVQASASRHDCESSSLRSSSSSGGTLVVFGASMVDVGENAEAMPLRSQAEFAPYGLDYFHRPAARFSNGRLLIDFVSQGLGYGLLDPFLKSIDPDFSHGVNFASSGSSARNTTVVGTGTSSSGLFSLDVQIDQFRNFKEKVLHAQSRHNGSLKSLPTTNGFLNAIYFIETAHNDYISTFTKSLNFDPLSVVASVISAMEGGIRELHNLGASTIIVMNVIPLGCTPGFLSFLIGSNSNATLDKDGCLTSINNVVDLHNTQLQHLIDKLRVELLLSNLVVFDANAIYRDAVHHPSKYGVKYPFKSCCGAGGDYNSISSIPCGTKGIFNGQELEATRCEDPSQYISWDGLHPVETFAKHLANGVLNGKHLRPHISIKTKLCKP